MTDKQLKTLLTPAPKNKEDKAFVSRVMEQVPKTDLSWRSVWTIRIVALVTGGAVLLWSNELTELISNILLLAHGSWSMFVLTGLLIAGTTLYICREKEII